MSAGPSRRGPTWRRALSWAALAVVVGVALVVGTADRSTPLTPRQRAAAIDAVIRCPSCDGISVADSSASTAAAVRQAVLARVEAGQSDARIEAFLVSRFGPDILLRPPVSGVTAWVWLLPPVGLAAAVVVLVLVLWRRRRERGSETLAVSEADREIVRQALDEHVAQERLGTAGASNRTGEASAPAGARPGAPDDSVLTP